MNLKYFRGTERNYSTSFLINLDPDLLSLCGTSAFDLTEEAIVGHTKRIFQTVRIHKLNIYINET